MKFEWNDLRAFITLINVILIMRFGLSIAWFSLGVATMGLIKDITIDKKLNGMIMHISNIILNLYFLFMIQRAKVGGGARARLQRFKL